MEAQKESLTENYNKLFIYWINFLQFPRREIYYGLKEYLLRERKEIFPLFPEDIFWRDFMTYFFNNGKVVDAKYIPMEGKMGYTIQRLACKELEEREVITMESSWDTKKISYNTPYLNPRPLRLEKSGYKTPEHSLKIISSRDIELFY